MKRRKRILLETIPIFVVAMFAWVAFEVSAIVRMRRRYEMEQVCVYFLLRIAQGMDEFERVNGKLPDNIPYYFIASLSRGSALIDPVMLDCPVASRREDVPSGQYLAALLPGNDAKIDLVARCQHHNCFAYRKNGIVGVWCHLPLPADSAFSSLPSLRLSSMRKEEKNFNALCSLSGVTWIPCGTNGYPQIADWSSDAATDWMTRSGYKFAD